MSPSSRPVIILGHGVRLGDAAHLVPKLMDIGIPVLTSWPAADLVDSDHPNYFGRPGVYGQRCANKVLAGADFILAIGCRLSIWTVGYDFPRDGQRVEQFNNAYFAIGHLLKKEWPGVSEWRSQCEAWLAQYPWIEAAHDEAEYQTPHRFMQRLQRHLLPDEIITADCASGSLAAHQVLRLKPPQRLMTSGGLGEMGCGIPAAIGASFAAGKKRVICLTSDGGIMLTLQELATIAHHRLPVKIVVFCNGGYGMIRDTQRNLGYEHFGVGAESLSFPRFAALAESFGIQTADSLETLLGCEGPALMTVSIDPEYRWAPKLRPKRNADGSISNADFAEMDPPL